MYEKYTDDTKCYLFTELTEEFLVQTAQLLNTEWPRSLNQRCSSLRSLILKETSHSGLKIPNSLILIDQKCNNKVIGHASLVSISAINSHTSDETTRMHNLTFLQSLIVDKEYRGKGFGKLIMLLTENYLIEFRSQNDSNTSSLNCQFLYLNTKDKQTFYEGLGYIRIEPILFFTNRESSRCTEIMKSLFAAGGSNQQINNAQQNSKCKKQMDSETIDFSVQVPSSTFISLTPLPTPAPPPPPPIDLPSKLLQSNEELFWYKKCLN
jgi:GNAT superfamily N-acetyltransferase